MWDGLTEETLPTYAFYLYWGCIRIYACGRNVGRHIGSVCLSGKVSSFGRGVPMKKSVVSAVIAASVLGFVGTTAGEAASAKSADVVITIKNEKSSALVFFSAAEKDISISSNMLKDVLAPKASVKVNIGKACKVMITADFEDESSIDPVAHDFCKDKVLTLIETE